MEALAQDSVRMRHEGLPDWAAADVAPAMPAQSLPLGRRSPRGRLRWYLVSCPEGREAPTCEKVRQVVPAGVLQDAFVPRAERIRKVHGTWVTDVRPLFRGYFVAVSADAPQLARALAKLTFPVSLAGSVGRGYAPMDERAQVFLEASMDATRTIRSSEGEIVSDELRVLWGPLKGQEARVERVNRRKCQATVRMGEGEGSFSLAMPLAIPVRR